MTDTFWRGRKVRVEFTVEEVFRQGGRGGWGSRKTTMKKVPGIYVS